MGKRKKSSKKPQGPKKKEPLPTIFACVFCNHEASVSVKLNKKAGTGDLSCKVCGQSFQTGINYLSAAVDVYSDWIDACDAVAKESQDHGAGNKSYSQPMSPGHARQRSESEAGGGYGGEDEGIVNDEEEPL